VTKSVHIGNAQRRGVAITSRGKRRPVIRRSWIYDILPQVPTWFCEDGYFAARQRFKANLATSYTWEPLSECPMCASSELRSIANQERHGLPISVDLCLHCALVFTNPRLSNKSLNDLYRRDYREIERGVRPDIHEFMFSLQASKGALIWGMISKVLGPRTQRLRITDIGCGEGGLLGWIAGHEKSVDAVGFELNLEAGQYGRSRGLDIRSEVFSGGAEAFDVVMLEQVLEHMHDPASLIGEIAATQKSGALLYIGVPGLLAFPEHYDGNFLTYLDYAHMYHFCLYTLERVVVPHGYKLISGTEAVHAVFQRMDDAKPAIVTKPISGPEMLEFFVGEERKFRERGSHFMRNRSGYRRYIEHFVRYQRGRLFSSRYAADAE
jgi:SAM-dependent methyltransferase